MPFLNSKDSRKAKYVTPFYINNEFSNLVILAKVVFRIKVRSRIPSRLTSLEVAEAFAC